MKHFYKDVPGFGNVELSRHAQDKMRQEGISEEVFRKILFEPSKPDTPDGQNIIWRERGGVRVVVLINPTPDLGAKLVKTVFRIKKGPVYARRL